ncbi:substrate-binding domain-containing protein [Bacteroidota bacterium]
MKTNCKFAKIKYSMIMLLLLIVTACDNSQKDPKATGKYESINSGTFTCYVDEAVWDFMQQPFRLYDSAYREIHPTFIKSSSREVMAQLLAGNTQAIITPRDYLKDEDSLMKEFKVDHHERAIYALDGLVFYTRKDFPLDTLTDEQIKDVLINTASTLKSYYPELKEDPVFICNDYNSSEFANLRMIALKDVPSFNKITFAKNSALVKEFVYKNSNAIGIGYLSQIVKDENLKCLRISFTDSAGKYIFPHVVHQANILRKYYPYIINHYVYILEKNKNRVYWFARFLEIEYIVQLYFNNSGIVPAYAKIRLVEEE